jgi:transcriptional regulator with XRE-family HTH domain
MDDEDAGGLGRRLRQAREARGWTVRGLALRAGLEGSIVSRLETGVQAHASSKTVKILAETLNVSADYLLAVQRKESTSAPPGTGCHHACPVPGV